MKAGREKLRIVHIFTHSSITRGGAIQGLLLAEMQHFKGHNVTCIFHKPLSAKPDKTFSSRKFKVPLIFKDMKNPVSYFWLSQFIARKKPHIIHCHRNLALLYAFFSARWLSITSWYPVIIINRGTTYSLPNSIIRYVFHSRGLDHIIAVSKAVKTKLIRDEAISPDKITVIYGSYDPLRFSPEVNGKPFRKEFKLTEDIPIVVCVAAIDKRKGIEYLIDAAKTVLRKDSRVRFFIVGSIEDYRYYLFLQEMINKRGLEEHFFFTGHREDVQYVLAACNVSVSASVEGEGITGALRESLAMKKPVVATNVSGNHEIIQDGKTGWLVPPRDPDALASALLQAILDRNEANRRASNGFKLISSLCSPEVRYAQVQKLYEKLISLRKLK